MRISDWSSDVCSSDLVDTAEGLPLGKVVTPAEPRYQRQVLGFRLVCSRDNPTHAWPVYGKRLLAEDVLAGIHRRLQVVRTHRQSDVQGKSVYVRVYTGGGRISKKKITQYTYYI